MEWLRFIFEFCYVSDFQLKFILGLVFCFYLAIVYSNYLIINYNDNNLIIC